MKTSLESLKRDISQMFETWVDKLSSQKEVMAELEEKLQKVSNLWWYLIFDSSRNRSLINNEHKCLFVCLEWGSHIRTCNTTKELKE